MATYSLYLAFGLSGWELGLVLALGVLLFGNKLPGVGKFLGRNVRGFKKGMEDIKDELKSVEAEVVEEEKKKDEKDEETDKADST